MFSLVYVILALLILAYFLQSIEHRDGFRFLDPILNLFSPIDFTWLTFSLTSVLMFTNFSKLRLLAFPDQRAARMAALIMRDTTI